MRKADIKVGDDYMWLTNYSGVLRVRVLEDTSTWPKYRNGTEKLVPGVVVEIISINPNRTTSAFVVGQHQVVRNSEIKQTWAAWEAELAAQAEKDAKNRAEHLAEVAAENKTLARVRLLMRTVGYEEQRGNVQPQTLKFKPADLVDLLEKTIALYNSKEIS